jgi:hypothetical protein
LLKSSCNPCKRLSSFSLNFILLYFIQR